MTKVHVQSIIIAVLVVALGGVGYVAAGKPAAAPAAAGVQPAPTLIIEKSHVQKLDTKAVILLMGSGYQPGQEIRIVVAQSDGSLSDIGSSLKPEPKANEFGVWATSWTVGEYVNKAIAKPDLYVLKACDTNYKVLATAPLGYYDAKADYAKLPAWAQAVVTPPAPAK